jgi:aspartokinase/homoserine dehydrogenase 1
LGRDGSDYSASIFGALLGARSVTIWTDVDGVYSAAPNMVRAAIVLPRLSYDEASELAYFGAKGKRFTFHRHLPD